ncbi:MAG: metal-dependent transcriptional regulator [Candidatus Syntropharchaeia archaeon]
MLTRKAEDYLETIYNISMQKEYVRIRDISTSLSVRPSSVIEMMKKLDERGLVIYKKYDGVKLTEKGKEIGKIVKDKHDAIKSFLEIIKVPEKIANEDACVMEHELHPQTVQQIKNLVEFVKTAPDYPEWLKHFEIFCKTGEHTCERGISKKI